MAVEANELTFSEDEPDERTTKVPYFYPFANS